MIQEDKIKEFLGLSEPWSLDSVIDKLAEASDILLNRYNYDGKNIFTHVFLKITYGEECYVCEALEKWKRTDWTKTEYFKYKNYELCDPARPFTQIEMLSMISEANEWIGKEYDKVSIGAQVWRTITGGRWIGITGKQAEKLVICSEGVATIVNHAVSWMFPFACALNQMDMRLSKNIKLSENQ